MGRAGSPATRRASTTEWKRNRARRALMFRVGLPTFRACLASRLPSDHRDTPSFTSPAARRKGPPEGEGRRRTRATAPGIAPRRSPGRLLKPHARAQGQVSSRPGYESRRTRWPVERSGGASREGEALSAAQPLTISARSWDFRERGRAGKWASPGGFGLDHPQSRYNERSPSGTADGKGGRHVPDAWAGHPTSILRSRRPRGSNKTLSRRIPGAARDGAPATAPRAQ